MLQQSESEILEQVKVPQDRIGKRTMVFEHMFKALSFVHHYNSRDLVFVDMVDQNFDLKPNSTDFFKKIQFESMSTRRTPLLLFDRGVELSLPVCSSIQFQIELLKGSIIKHAHKPAQVEFCSVDVPFLYAANKFIPNKFAFDKLLFVTSITEGVLLQKGLPGCTHSIEKVEISDDCSVQHLIFTF